MIHIYGTKTITITDLFGDGGESYSIKWITEHHEDIVQYFEKHKMLLTVKYVGTYHMQGFVMKCIPFRLVEEYIWASSMAKFSQQAASISISQIMANRASEIHKASFARLNMMIDDLNNNYQHRISEDVCLILVYNGDLAKVVVRRPNHIIERVEDEIEYKCKECDYTELVTGNELPNMYYQVKDNTILYYCEKHRPKNERNVNVGDTFTL